MGFDASDVDFGQPGTGRTRPSRSPHAASRPPEQPRGLLEIQRAAGNAATVELIRRQRAAPTVMRQPVDTAPAPGVDDAANAAGDAASTAGRPTLRFGSQGDDVKILQMKLRNLRERMHDRDAARRARIDGIFGPLTRQDVVDFQTDTGLDADGVAGPKTWDALDSLVPQTPLESDEVAADDRFNAAVAMKHDRKYDEALAEFDAMFELVDQPERKSLLDANAAECHQQRGRFDLAVERYERSLTARFNQEELRAETLGRLSMARNNVFLNDPAPDPEPAPPGTEQGNGEAAPGRSGGGIVGHDEVKAGDTGDGPDLFKGKLANILIGWLPELLPGNAFDDSVVARTKIFQQQVGFEQTGVGDGTTWHALDTFSKADVPFSVVGPLLVRLRAAFTLSKSDPVAGLAQLQGGRDEAEALGLAEIAKNTEALIGQSHHRLALFYESFTHSGIYLGRVIPSPLHYGFHLEALRRAHAHEPLKEF